MNKTDFLVTAKTNNIFAVIGREELESCLNDFPDGLVLISITDPELKHVETNTKFVDELKLKFWDVEEEFLRFCPIHPLQAKQIKDFILLHKYKKFLINCEAGISRSAGIACAIEVLLRDTYLFPKESHVVSKIRQHWRYDVNNYVYKSIIEAK